jgi:hypothetical protein
VASAKALTMRPSGAGNPLSAWQPTAPDAPSCCRTSAISRSSVSSGLPAGVSMAGVSVACALWTCSSAA